MAVHVYPLNDYIDHQVEQDAGDCDCPCEPEIQWNDDDGELLPEPIVVHKALDGRK